MSWTEEKVSKLKELWGKGNTASQIAEIIGMIREAANEHGQEFMEEVNTGAY